MSSFSRKRRKTSFGDDDDSSSSSSSDDFGNDDDDDDIRLETMTSTTTTAAALASPMGGAATINNGHGNVLVRRATVDTSLSKKLLEVFRPKDDSNDLEPPKTKKTPPKVSDETADALSEVIRMFVVEAHNRAMIEAECDAEGEELDNDDDEEEDDDDNEMLASADHKDDSDGDNSTKKKKKKDDTKTRPVVPIHAKHVTKIAAELLMDFS